MSAQSSADSVDQFDVRLGVTVERFAQAMRVEFRRQLNRLALWIAAATVVGVAAMLVWAGRVQ